ncbi:DNA polymerase delta, subunit 4-domain-containing protein [Morchella snyderi]|nr:DNA polymerase delta, subunit 4-domain-containing protein [Morchella snyderi]
MPPRRASRSSSGGHQAILSFRTPSKIVKSTTHHPPAKKDAAASPKKRVSSSISISATSPSSSPLVNETTLSPTTTREATNEALAEYYKTHILDTRRSQPLHQEDMSLQDKVLRHWDMSSQYGPCIGISRLERWRRAERMGLRPPVLVGVVCEGLEGGGRAWLEEALSLSGLCQL